MMMPRSRKGKGKGRGEGLWMILDGGEEAPRKGSAKRVLRDYLS